MRWILSNASCQFDINKLPGNDSRRISYLGADHGPNSGTFVESSLNGLAHYAFVPAPPPPDALLALDNDLAVKRDRALVALGELKGIARILSETTGKQRYRIYAYQAYLWIS